MSEEELEESPYCEVCGTCGEIGCCGIRNFISEHIEGKTNCKNEGWIIQDLINLCEYKDEVFKENKRLKKEIDRLNNIRVKALEFIYKELIPENVRWDYDDCIFSDLPVERIKPLVDILELKENKNG